MKKSTLGLFILTGILFISCSSTLEVENTISNSMHSEDFTLDTNFKKEAYSVIGYATGNSETVWYSPKEFKIYGDTGKYGYFNETNINSNLLERTYVTKNREALEIAKLTANYNLIQNVYKMGGDSILEPIYIVHKAVETEKNFFLEKLLPQNIKFTYVQKL